MKVLIDTCVLFPTLLREIVIGTAKAGFFEPRWSQGILDEWRHAMAREGEDGLLAVESEIAILAARFPSASVNVLDQLKESLHLPDPDDRHVLAAAISGECEELLTLNLKDFQSRTLSMHGVLLRDPDGFLVEFLSAEPEKMLQVIGTAVKAAQLRKPEVTKRGLLKRARLPKLGKALYG